MIKKLFDRGKNERKFKENGKLLTDEKIQNIIKVFDFEETDKLSIKNI
jgi:hypothetical protein